MRSNDLRRYVRDCAVLVLLCSALLACGGPEGERLGTEVSTEFVDQVTGDQQGSGSVTVTAVRRGSVDDLSTAFDLDDDQLGMSAYYVDVEFTNDSGAAVDLHAPSGVDADGDLWSPLVVVSIGTAPPYDACPALPGTLAGGSDVTGCAIVLVPEGAELERVSYLPGAGAEPVYWLAR